MQQEPEPNKIVSLTLNPASQIALHDVVDFYLSSNPFHSLDEHGVVNWSSYGPGDETQMVALTLLKARSLNGATKTDALVDIVVTDPLTLAAIQNATRLFLAAQTQHEIAQHDEFGYPIPSEVTGILRDLYVDLVRAQGGSQIDPEVALETGILALIPYVQIWDYATMDPNRMDDPEWQKLHRLALHLLQLKAISESDDS